MACLGVQPRAAGWKAQTNPLSYGSTPIFSSLSLLKSIENICQLLTSGQSYKASTIVNYDSRVIPDLKIPHITTMEL